MVRRYAQPVRVGTVPRDVPDSPAGFENPPIAGLAGVGGPPIGVGHAAGSPMWFEWAGRRYHVRAVLAQWRERRAWWRDVLDADDPDQVVHPIASPAEVSAQPDRSAIAVAARERLVWRVEAGPGWRARTGVFDLACDELGPGAADPSGWMLLRVSD